MSNYERTTAEVVNLIISKLRTGPVKFVEIRAYGNELQFIWIKYGQNLYKIFSDLQVEHEHDGAIEDSYSQWIEGVLNGKVRNDAGDLLAPVHAVNEWMGHDGKVGSKHYDRVKESDREKVISPTVTRTVTPTDKPVSIAFYPHLYPHE